MGSVSQFLCSVKITKSITYLKYLLPSFFRRILFDTGDGQKPEFFLNLKKSLNFDRITLSSIILSHWHDDHVGGVQEVVNVAEVRLSNCIFRQLDYVLHKKLFSNKNFKYDLNDFIWQN